MDAVLGGFSDDERARLSRTPRELDSGIRRAIRLQRVVLGVLVAASVATLVVYVPGFRARHPVLFWAILLVPAVRLLSPLFALLGRGTPLAEVDPHELGELTAEEAAALAADVATRLGGYETPRLWLVPSKQGNAAAINSMFFDFVPGLNSIRLTSYLFRAMGRDELRAVLAHELAHFHRYMSPLGRNQWLGVLMSVAALFACFSEFPLLARANFFGVAWLAFLLAPTPFLVVMRAFAASGSRDQEIACDAVAAEVVGPLPIINALLKLGDRAEIYELVEDAVATRLEADPRASTGHILRSLLDRIPEGPISVEEARRLLERSDSEHPPEQNPSLRKGFLARVARNRRLRAELKAARWQDFDHVHRDHRLDAEELHAYLHRLAAQALPATHMVASQHPEREPDETHPSARKRITYVYLHYVRDGGAPAADRILGPALSRTGTGRRSR